METKLNFSVSYDDLLKTHNGKAANFDKAYEQILGIDPWQNLDKVIDFVRRWNSRVPIGRNIKGIKECLLSLKEDFNHLADVNLESFNCEQRNLIITEHIFKQLSKLELKTPKEEIVHLKSTGVSKFMSAINQNLFVMWDNGIADYYGCALNAKGYLRFMETMQGIAIEILKKHKKEEILRELNEAVITLPKLLDEYNWMKFSTSKIDKME